MPTRTSLLQPTQFAHYIFLSAYPYLQLCPLSCFLNIPKFIPYEAYKYLLFYIQYESTFREVWASIKLFSCIFQFFHFTDFFFRYSVPCIFSSYTQKKFFSASLLLPAWFLPLCPTCPSFADTTCCIFRVRSWRTSCYVGIHMFSTRNYQLIPKSWISCG